MIVSDRNKLYNLAYTLDSLPRARLTAREAGEMADKRVKSTTLMRRRIQEKTHDLYVLIPSDDLETISELIRSLVSADEERHAS